MKIKVIAYALALLFVMSLCGCQNSMYMKDMQAIELAQTVAEAPEQTPTPTPEPVVKEYTREERNEFTNNYKTMWQAVDKKLKQLDVTEDSNGVKRYSEKNALLKLEIGQDTYGTKDLNYEREYYFEDGELYFALLTQEDTEMRFYFHEHQLIRWIDGDNNAYDNEEAHQEFKTYGISLLSEADRLSEEFEADQVILNSYVTG